MKRLLLCGLLLCLATTLFAQKAPPAWAPSDAPYKPAETHFHDLIHTKLAISFDWEKQHVLGEATLTLKPWFYPQSTLVLDAKGMDIHKVQLVQNGKPKGELEYTYDDAFLTIELDREYTREEEFTVYIDYTAKPAEYEAPGSAAITGANGVYFINHDGSHPTKPQQIWTQGETEASSVWFPTIDQPNERCTEEISITVQDRFVTGANGVLVDQKKNNDGTRTDTWKLDLPHAPYLFAFIVGEFEVYEDEWDGIPLVYYLEPGYKDYVDEIFGQTPAMMEFFSRKLGVRYPWPNYKQAVVRDFVSGAMENTTMTIHYEPVAHDDRSHLDNDQQSIVAHELFHQWFGDLVTTESWPNLPLNESFADYSQYLWDQERMGTAFADETYWTSLSQYLGEAQTKREPLIRYHVDDPNDMFDAHSYNKGGKILHMLRLELGDEAFFAGLNLYLERHKYTAVEIHELRMAFEDVTGRDLFWFFDQWFMSPGHPELSVNYNYDPETKELTVNIQQTQNQDYIPVFELRTQLLVHTPSGKQYMPVHITEADTTLTYTLDEAPLNVDLDPSKYTVAAWNETKPVSYWLTQVKEGDTYMARRYALEKTRGKAGREAAVQTVFLELLEDDFWAIRRDALNAFQNRTPDDTKAFFATLRSMATDDPNAAVRAQAVALLTEYKGHPNMDVDALVGTLTEAVQDSSYAVVTSALQAYNELSPTQAVIEARKQEDAYSGDLKLTVALIYLQNNEPGAIDYLAKIIDSTPESLVKFNTLQRVGPALATMQGEQREKAIAFLMDVAENYKGLWYMRLAAAQALFPIATEDDAVYNFLVKLRDNEQEPQMKALLTQQMPQR